METARRMSKSAWNGFVDCNVPPRSHRIRQKFADHLFRTAFFLTAHFSQEDYPYDW